MHRLKGWKRDERGVEKSGKRDDWYKRGGDEVVIFVPATPGSQLQKKYQSEIRNKGYKIKLVEKTGTTLKKVPQKSNPFKQQRCGKENFFLPTTIILFAVTQGKRYLQYLHFLQYLQYLHYLQYLQYLQYLYLEI